MEFLELFRPVLKTLILPPGLYLLLLLLALLLGRGLLGRALLTITLLGTYLLSTPAATHWLAPQVEIYPPLQREQLAEKPAQAILVLSAGYNINNPELDGGARPDAYSMQRLDYAVKLARDTRLPIIVSGGRLQENAPALAEVLGDWLSVRDGVTPLALETRSRTTWENLEYSLPLLHDLDIERVVLVTHAFHMARAMQAAETHGVKAIPAPLAYFGKNAPIAPPGLPASDWMPRMDIQMRNYLLLHELLGSHWYRWKS